MEGFIGTIKKVGGVGIELVESRADGGGRILKRGENEGSGGGTAWCGGGLGQGGFKGGHGSDFGVEAGDQFAINGAVAGLGGGIGWLGLGIRPGVAGGQAIGQVEGDGGFTGFRRAEEEGGSAQGDAVGEKPGQGLWRAKDTGEGWRRWGSWDG